MMSLLSVAAVAEAVHYLLRRFTSRARNTAAPGEPRRADFVQPKVAVVDERTPLRQIGAAPRSYDAGHAQLLLADSDDGGGPERETIFDRRRNSVLETIGVSSAVEAIMRMHSLNDLSDVMKLAGLEHCNLIFGIDYTASNKQQGAKSFNGRSLHTIEDGVVNPYQEVIEILGKTLERFATSKLGIPAYGFGDLRTSDSSVFPLNGETASCTSFDELLDVYNRVTPNVILSGPTNFAPVITKAIDVCKLVRDYHILVIIADGQVTNELATRRAIVDACNYPLSIIVVGVGDGPWQMMTVFDSSLPKRPWDNFHFVDFNEVKAKTAGSAIGFAIETLLEIPDQFKHIKQLGLLKFDNAQSGDL